ncbi:MAG TPA: AraC family transcriptional regulator [Pseudonocardia sp.]|jgi:AraC-like DNA-binding protein|uniref:AraC family transcriptional regulator n=1 Tax=Pseudonocardia sp. TaxID=60912 RepID=UPI002B4B3575|nr:AraC family transcriptional regulator [Pseudonocardia sp.]HLU53976.1 AraC family transcriptional regulator [Pseudonocardia sp.]
MDVERVALHLARPPFVANVGVGVHGVRSPHDVYRLPDLWQLHLYGYSAEVTIGGRTYAVAPGWVSFVPAGVEVRFDYTGRSEHLFAHFRPEPAGEPSVVPVVRDAGAASAGLSDLLRAAISASPGGSARVAAEVWAALWRIAQLPEPAGVGTRHAAVATAIDHIEANLARPLSVPDVARVAGVSHNHLTRLFRAETGLPVVGWIRRRRMARAQHLLTATTMSIPAVAASVGIHDLQAFNKACRRELGASPRAIRAGATRASA